MIDYHEAIKAMHTGAVVKYIGTINGNVWTDRGWSWCMCRGCIFPYDGGPVWKLTGRMVYDPDFRYELTGERVDPRAWKPEKKQNRKEIKSKLGYSRIGLNNV